MANRQTPYQFFYLNAGYSYVAGSETERQGRQRCARELAQAEREARNAGLSFQWSHDPEIDSSEFNGEEPAYATWVCIARDSDGKICGTLGGIDFGRDGEPWGAPYRRVIEAEIAMEASGNASKSQD